MPTLDENLFGRIAVLNNFLRQDQLDECLKLQWAETPQRRIGEILREKGYLTDEQLRMIQAIGRRKLRKVTRNSRDLIDADRRLGELALSMKLVDLDGLEEGILEQQRLAALNLHFRLGEILVARGKIKSTDVLELLRVQGKRILICPSCDMHFNVQKFREGGSYYCTKCHTRLFEPKFLDTVSVDSVLDGP